MGGKGGNVVLVASEGNKTILHLLLFQVYVCSWLLFFSIDVSTLQKVLKKYPTKVVKASEGENSHVHRLVGQPGADFMLPVPSGISVYTEKGAKIGKFVFNLTNKFIK